MLIATKADKDVDGAAAPLIGNRISSLYVIVVSWFDDAVVTLLLFFIPKIKAVFSETGHI